MQEESKPLLGNAPAAESFQNYGVVQEQGYPSPVEAKVLSAPEQAEMKVGPFYEPELDKRFYGTWSDGLCDCFSDLQTCILGGSLLQGLLVYQIMDRLPLQYRKMALFGVDDPVKASLLYYALFFFIAPLTLKIVEGIFVYKLSIAVAERFQIPHPRGCDSLLKALFCSCCYLSQMARHVGRAQGFIRVQKDTNQKETAQHQP